MARDRRSDGRSEEATLNVPLGVKLLRTLEGHEDCIFSVSFDPSGRTLASGDNGTRVILWDVARGKRLQTLEEHQGSVWSVSFDPSGRMLASGGLDGRVNLWDAAGGKLLRTLEGHGDCVYSVSFAPSGGTLAGASERGVTLWDSASGKLVRNLEGHQAPVRSVSFDPSGSVLASGSYDRRVILWDPHSGKLVHTLEGHEDIVNSVSFDPSGQTLASGSHDKRAILWDAADGKLLRILEGHTSTVECLRFSPDGRLLVSTSRDGTIRVWRCDTWEAVAVIPEPENPYLGRYALAFHPILPVLATTSSTPDASYGERGKLIHLWELDLDILLGTGSGARRPCRAVHHTTGKIVLVGDHSVGKSALGYRMIHGHFEKQESTHGQQFWVFPALGKRRTDGTECEAILWDFAGQPDYRLVHALFVDDSDLALVLFDASDIRDPLHGVGFWLKQLQAGRTRCPIILVAAQTDRGTCTLTAEELMAFCQKHAIAGPIHTSAFTGTGVPELIEQMKAMVPWGDKPATVTTTTFKRIKDYVLGLKEAQTDKPNIVTPEELRRRLAATDAEWCFTDAEMLTAVGHLENYGYVKKLRTSKGQERILLAPELLNNLASSFVLEARRGPKGLGSLEERRLLAGGYAFPELARLTEGERDILLDAAALLFLEHNVCFRETDPLRMEAYLVFPELINLKKPTEEEKATEDGVAYTVTGPTENVFASLVVLLGYTHTFTRTNQWQNNARYEVGDGLVCGFRQEAERDGELDFVLCFCPRVGQPVRTLFQGLFESFLARRNLTVLRYEPVVCSKGHALNRNVVRELLQHGDESAFCSKCGEKLALPKMAEPIQLTRKVQAEVDAQRRAAEQRTRFEQIIFRVQNYVTEQKIKVRECFISYAWGVPEHERWVRRLTEDLAKAGIQVVYDRKDNQFGDSLSRFISRIPYCASVIPVGTPLYFRKFENRLSTTGSVVAAEVDLISQRLLGTQEEKRAVKPVLLAGEKKTSLPPLMWDLIHADFREEEAYFRTAFDLILTLYGIMPGDRAVVDLWESLRGPWLR
jgi:small GTP-binding protein